MANTLWTLVETLIHAARDAERASINMAQCGTAHDRRRAEQADAALDQATAALSTALADAQTRQSAADRVTIYMRQAKAEAERTSIRTDEAVSAARRILRDAEAAHAAAEASRRVVTEGCKLAPPLAGEQPAKGHKTYDHPCDTDAEYEASVRQRRAAREGGAS